jgi:hypothetical protein
MTKAECAKWLKEHWNTEELLGCGPRRLLPLLYQLGGAYGRKTPLPLTKLAQEIGMDFLFYALRSGWSDEEVIEEVHKGLAFMHELEQVTKKRLRDKDWGQEH